MPGTPITSLLGTLQPSLRDLLTPGLQFMVISHSRVSLVVEIKYSRHIPASKGQAGALDPLLPGQTAKSECPPATKAQTSHSPGLLYLHQHPNLS